MEILKPFHYIWWAIWVDCGQPTWMLPILKWLNSHSGDGRYERKSRFNRNT